jgi:hypothetical protein
VRQQAVIATERDNTAGAVVQHRKQRYQDSLPAWVKHLATILVKVTMVFTLSRIDSPVVGCGYERDASSVSCAANSA